MFPNALIHNYKRYTQLWQKYFSILLNSVHNTDSKEFVSEHIEHRLSSVQKTTVSASDVLDSLKAVKLGKAAGIDGLSAEHFVCAHTKISVHLSLLFTIDLLQLLRRCQKY